MDISKVFQLLRKAENLEQSVYLNAAIDQMQTLHLGEEGCLAVSDSRITVQPGDPTVGAILDLKELYPRGNE